MAPELAQPPAKSGSARSARRGRRLAPAGICNDINTAWHPEREFLVGQANILLQVLEREYRGSALGVRGHHPPQQQRAWLDEQDEAIVIRLRLPWHKLQRANAGRTPGRRIDERGGEIAGQVALAGQKQGGC